MNSVPTLMKAALLTLGLVGVLSLSSCNAVSGLGRDIENTGNALENAAN